MRKAALLVFELALSQRVINTGLVVEVVGKPAPVPLGAIVVVIKLSAYVFCRLGADDLSLDGVREKAVEAIFTIPHVEVNAGVVASIDMDLAALGVLLTILALALADCEVLVGTKIFDLLQLSF